MRQREALGLGHAILHARDLVGDEPFAVLLSDDIADVEKPALGQMLDVYERYYAPVLGTMQVEGEGVYQIEDMVEKPAFERALSDLAIIRSIHLDARYL